MGCFKDEGEVYAFIGRLFQELAVDPELAPKFQRANTTVQLPGWAEGARFENVLTGELVLVKHGAVRLADAFQNFPGAALRALDARD